MDYTLILAISGAILLLLFLVLKLKIQAFLALLITSLFAGLLAGMEPETVIESVSNGMGSTLGFVATVVGLGALFGAILEHSGGTQAIASFLLKKFGNKNAPLAMVVAGFIIAIPVFFDVAFIILVPVLYALQKTSGKSLLLYGIPLLAGLAITHSFIPPTPGPVAVADIIGANLGWVVLAGFISGIPTALVSGLLFGKFISKKIHIEIPDYAEYNEEVKENPPSVLSILLIIFIPIFLILTNTLSTSGILPFESNLLVFLGHPFTALIIANLLAWYFLGLKRGASKDELLKITSKSLAPAGIIILLTGAGGAFKQVLIDTGAGNMIATAMSEYGISVLVFGFIIAALVRVLQGSSTVAMITAAGVSAPILESASHDFYKALLVISIASGATVLSHVNDSGFWLVNRYFGLTEKQTLASWTVMETLIGVTGFLTALLLSTLV